MDNYPNNIKNSFSKYVLKAVKNCRKHYLDKKYKVEGHEISDDANMYNQTGDAGDLFCKLEKTTEKVYEGIAEMKDLMNQVGDYKLYQILTALPEKQKKLILLRVFYEQSFAEIGRHMGISDKKAENTYYNTIKKIRKQLGGDIHGV